jgi:hypothetical protein
LAQVRGRASTLAKDTDADFKISSAPTTVGQPRARVVGLVNVGAWARVKPR